MPRRSRTAAQRRAGRLDDIVRRVDRSAHKTIEAKNQTIEAQKLACDAMQKAETALEQVHMSLYETAAKVMEACGSDKDPNCSATLLQMVVLTDAANRQLEYQVQQQETTLKQQRAITEVLCSKLGISYEEVGIPI